MSRLKEDVTNSRFVSAVQRALVYLYDPAELRKSPLLGLLGLEQRESSASALQSILLKEVDSLRPEPDVPPQSNAWRIYRTLYHRYTEQCTQREVATTLGLSTRQLRRQEHQAVRILADHLWTHYGVQLRASAGAARRHVEKEEPPAQPGTPSREREMRWLQSSLPSEAASAAEEIQAALLIIDPLKQTLKVEIRADLPESLPPLAMPPAILRQALLNVLLPAVRLVPSGEVRISAEVQQAEVCIGLLSCKGRSTTSPASHDDVENLEMARQLLGLCGGRLETTPGEGERVPLDARLILPVAQRAAVLAIDDNADTLRLFQRCLAGSPYPFIGVSDAQQALTMAQELVPRVVILDLMLPEADGWELLGRLREHPRTRGVPIVVCSILPQEQLALALGAAAFLRKPVSRAALLSTLDQLLGQRVRRVR